jgi:hypothetical protein
MPTPQRPTQLQADNACRDQNARNLERIATALERIATVLEAGLALAMQHTNTDAETVNALVVKLKTSTDALNAAQQAAGVSEKGKS